MKQSSDATFYFDQSIGFMLFFIKKSLVFRKKVHKTNGFFVRKVDKMSKKRIVHGDCFTFYTKYVINVREEKLR